MEKIVQNYCNVVGVGESLSRDPVKRMQNCLNSLGIGLTVCWCPEPNKSVHGEIRSDVLLIYDEQEQDAWETFTHEVLEVRLRKITQPYRILINSLIDVVEKMRRLEKTLENTRIMSSKESNGRTKIVPAIHGYSEEDVEWFLKKLCQIARFPYVGIGSLVPSVFNTKGAGGITNVIKIVNFVRKKMPDVKIHVFGVGSTLTMHLMFYAGADSVDSSGWRTKAAFGAIQLSRIGDRYVTKRKRNKKYLDLSKEEERLIEECGCPICRNQGLDALRTEFEARAMHNAWVYQQEVEKARKLINNGEYEDYVKDSLSRSPFSNAVGFIEKMLSNNNA